MKLLDAAEKYVIDRGIARTPVYAIRRFVRTVGNKRLQDVTFRDTEVYVEQAKKDGVSANTMWGTMKDLRTLASHYDVPLKTVSVKRERPCPAPPSLEDIGKIYQQSPLWMRQMLVVGHVTTLRLHDLLSLMLKGFDPACSHITWTASKTEHVHRWPVPSWVRRHLYSCRMPISSATHDTQRTIRRILRKVCRLAGVSEVTPKLLRQRALTEWAVVSGRAVDMAHGCGLNTVLRHYVDPLTILEAGVLRLRVPDVFLTEQERQHREDMLLQAYRQLDQTGRKLIVDTAVRLVGG